MVKNLPAMQETRLRPLGKEMATPTSVFLLHPLQYSCLENPMDSGAWWATVFRVAKTRTGTEQHFLSFFLELFSLSSPVGYWTSICLEAYLSVSYLFAFSSCSWGS